MKYIITIHISVFSVTTEVFLYSVAILRHRHPARHIQPLHPLHHPYDCNAGIVSDNGACPTQPVKYWTQISLTHSVSRYKSYFILI